MNAKKLCDEIQFRKKDKPTNKRNEEGEAEVFEAGEVFIESLDRVIHITLNGLEDLCLDEFFEELF